MATDISIDQFNSTLRIHYVLIEACLNWDSLLYAWYRSMFPNSTLKLIIHAKTPMVPPKRQNRNKAKKKRASRSHQVAVIKLALMISKSIIESANKTSVDLNWVNIKRARYSVVSSNKRDGSCFLTWRSRDLEMASLTIPGRETHAFQ